MNPDLRNLIALQDLELNITGLLKETSQIPDKIQTLESELSRIRAEYDQEVVRAKELANQKRTFEGEVEMLQTKLSRFKEQLMTVKTNKEYTAMLHEIQTAEDHIRSEEDKILDIMEKTEDMESYLKKAEQEMLKKSEEIQEKIEKTKNSAPQLESELGKLQEEKTAIEKIIEASLLDRYRLLVKANKGVALAEARDELCSACHIRIRPQIYAELLQTNNIYTCDSCSRILFHRENS
ncbi:MAG: C4-type zinc ribbon domain-containing protein [Acidobacteriota bacterium]